MLVRDKILGLLRDGKIHFSAEFRDKLGLLEYRQGIDQLRKRYWVIDSIEFEHRPAWILRGKKLPGSFLLFLCQRFLRRRLEERAF